eukprot:jgi/Tetstr1/427649/TSEL_017774.t1
MSSATSATANSIGERLGPAASGSWNLFRPTRYNHPPGDGLASAPKSLVFVPALAVEMPAVITRAASAAAVRRAERQQPRQPARRTSAAATHPPPPSRWGTRRGSRTPAGLAAGIRLASRVIARAAEATTKGPPPEPEAPKLETEVTVTDLGNGVSQLRINCADKMAYEVEYSLNKGTSENFYIFQSDNAVTLLGIPDNLFAEAFLEALPSVCPAASIANIIIPHFTPKRLKALEALIAARADSGELPMLHCGNPALTPLKTALPETLLEGRDYRISSVRNGSAISVGPRKLRVTLTPTPRWPDLFCIFDSATETLFTSKLFGSHVCTPDVYDDADWDEMNEDFRHYFDCTLGASAKQAKKALQKLAGYVIGDGGSGNSKASYVQQLAPLHGMVVRNHSTELIREYNEWTDKQIA